MKKLIILIVLLFSFSVFSQNIEYSIVVKDIETQLPIENAMVVVIKTQQILISNSEGKVAFALKGISNIEVSHGDYKDFVIRWTNLEKDNFVVYLESKNNKLDEIILSKEVPQKTLQKIVTNSLEKITSSYRLKVYVREFFLLEDRYSYFNDGLVNFQFEVEQKKVSTTLLVEQNRAYGLIDSDVSADLKGYDLNDIMENYCNFKYFDVVLDKKNKKEYDFTIRGHKTNKEHLVMTIGPTDKAKKGLDTYEIIYNPEKKLIIEYTIITKPENLPMELGNLIIGTKNITRSAVKVNYRLDGPNYYVLNSSEEIAYDLASKEGIKNIRVHNNFVTTNFNIQKFTYKESDVFKEKTLFNKKNKIFTNYWDISGFIATDEEKAIINSLEFKL